MITILNAANAPQGPFTREQVAHRLAAGEFTLDSLAHVEGLTQWTPLRDVLARVDAHLAPPPPVAAPSAPAYSYAVTMQPPEHLVYAGFWIRFAAYFIDGMILGAAGFAFVLVFGVVLGIFAVATGNEHLVLGVDHRFNGQDFSANANVNPVIVFVVVLMELAFYIIMLAGTWLYFAKLESGPRQATLGKQLLGLRVTDLTGQRIGFGRATGRFFSKIISAIPFDIGFIMAGFTERKQALHDMIAGTLVVRS